MLAVETVVSQLKELSKPVTTPEEIAQVRIDVFTKKNSITRWNQYLTILTNTIGSNNLCKWR